MTFSLKKNVLGCSPESDRKRIESLSTASWFESKKGFSYRFCGAFGSLALILVAVGGRVLNQNGRQSDK
jgi:hypothetical protein